MSVILIFVVTIALITVYFLLLVNISESRGFRVQAGLQLGRIEILGINRRRILGLEGGTF